MLAVNRIEGVGCILCNVFRRKSYFKSRKLQYESANRSIKEENAKILKRYNKENKSLFGKLVETSSQKKKRERIEVRNLESDILSDKCDKPGTSEAWWMINSFKTKSYFATTPLSSEQDRICTSVNESHYIKDINANVQLSNQVVNDSIVDVDKSEKSNKFHKLNLRLPQIIVKNITSFPLDNRNKQTRNNELCSSPILSLPVKEDSDVVKNQSKEFPSVSRILNATMSEASKAALQKWKENLIAELGEEGFQKYQKALLEHGSMFHSSVQQFLSGVSLEELKIDSAVEGCWLSLQTMMKGIGEVRALESHVVHPGLMYHGIIDCVAEYKGKLLLIEWKKSNKQKSAIWSTYDAPLQVAAYLGAMNFDDNYDLKVRGGLVVVAYTDGSPAHVHHLDASLCQKYWQMWLERLQLYWDLLNKQDMRIKSHM